MILRTYRVQVRPGKLEAYEAFERDEGLPMVLGMPGCLGAGFGRVREEKELVFVFTTLWESQAHLERARATPTWKAVAGKLEALDLTVGDDRSEHLELVDWRFPRPQKR